MIQLDSRGVGKVSQIEQIIGESLPVFLQREYIEKKRDRCDIGRQLGVTEGGVERWLKKLQIPIRGWQAATNVRFDLENMPTELTENEKQVIYGSLMGDGNIEKKSSGGCHYNENHCVEQKEYLLWKAEQLTRFRPYFKQINSYNKPYRLTTSPAPILKDVYSKFYNKKKFITRTLLNEIDQLGLAVWYQDDGNYSKGSSEIYTMSFTYEEHLIMQEYFQKKWNIDVHIGKSRKYNVLRFIKTETKKLINIVQPYIHDTMKYKIGE